MKHSKPKGEKRPIAGLNVHPRQHEFFGVPLPCEIDELAADLKQNGLLTPVEVLPTGTIIAGHKRVAAARLLGWTEIEVWVRHDLADKPGLAEKRLIEDNLHRRQLGPLELARSYRALKAVGCRGRGKLSDQDHADLRDQIATRLGVSGRTLDRYLRVLDTPPEVQNAVAARKLGITLAEKAASLSRSEQDQIAAQIRAGGIPSTVINAFFNHARNRGQHGKPFNVERCVAALKQVQKIYGTCLSDTDSVLIEQVKSLLRLLRQRRSRRSCTHRES